MKLPTKVLIIFTVTSLIVFGGLVFYVLPKVNDYLVDREITYAESYLEMAAHDVQSWLGLSGTKTPDDVKKVFDVLNDRFAKYYFHESGRLFVINANGEFVTYSDQFARGKPISNHFLFEDGERRKLIERILADRIKFASRYAIEESGPQGALVRKALFVTPVAGTDYFVCISVNEEDLYYSTKLVTQSLRLLLILTLLIIILVFHFFYYQVRKRFDTVVGRAQRIAVGDYEARIEDTSRDEIGVLAGVINDLARHLQEKRHLEYQLRRAQKMELVGTLASGITHDFNNILGGISSSVDLVLREIESPAVDGQLDVGLIREMMRVAKDCVRRGCDTVEQMLSFARKSERAKRLIDLNSLVGNVSEICRHSFDKRIAISFDAYRSAAVISGDPSQLEQAILNVCINARDAMGSSGELNMSVDLTTTHFENNTRFSNEQAYYCLTVRDSGEGMTPETLDKVFEPFFTTKARGTGLGLAMVYKIVNEHGGWIDVKSQRNVGTTFCIYLPAGQGTVEQVVQESVARKKGDNETILVVDDDHVIMHLTQSILKRIGYKSIAAYDGKQAVEIYREQAGEIDMVILDLNMPILAGDEAYAKLKALDPSVKVLVISGFERDKRVFALLQSGCCGFLRKPFSLDDLSERVRDILDS